jgi:sodium transport system ATP-binding protein
MAVIAFDRMRKRYAASMAVDGVSFLVPDGCVTGLIGPNGAGKTTLLRMLSGLIRPDAGTVMVDDVDVQQDRRAARARLGVLPETVGLYERLTVREHLHFGGALQGLGAKTLGSRVERALAQFGLASLAERRAGTLSLGERRRVAVARAVIHEPRNVVFDEPTSGLDVLSAREVRREVRRLAEDGCAVVLSSHVMSEVAAVCHRLVILARGRIVATGTPAEILARAGTGGLEDAFVALIGSEEGLNA